MNVKCDFCDAPAVYDFKTKIGPWAYGCLKCWKKNRFSQKIGIGFAKILKEFKDERT